jgi:hypothetical protein
MSHHILHQDYGKVVNVLGTEVEIGPAFDRTTEQPPKTVKFRAIWDTGATGTLITANVVQALGLKPIGVVNTHHAGGSDMAPVFKVCARFPGGPGFTSLRVIQGKLPGFDVLVGMDIIANGDFLVTTHGGKTCLTFQLPSLGGAALQDHLDKALKNHAAKQAASKPPMPAKPYAGTGRNKPCPCGSGEKYKNCCGV